MAEKASNGISLRALLEAGVHFGHQARRWHPKMRAYLYGERGGIHIFDLVKTKERLEEACKYAQRLVAEGGLIIFVGTKRQAQGIVRESALRSGMPYVTQRWFGGLLTNFNQLKKSLDKLNTLKSQRQEGKYSDRTKKERLLIDREIARLEKFLGGVANLEVPPQALFIVDTHNEKTAVKEANQKGIPIIGIVDSNSNPDSIDYVIPANDDAVKSIQIIVNYIADAIIKAKEKTDKKKSTDQN